jgi:hypothetical protein
MRPQSNEYAPSYAPYIDKAPEDDIAAALELQIDATRAVLAPLSEERALHRYAPGKWSVKEIVGHVIDGERVFAYRAMSIARGEQQSLPGFDENEYMVHATFDERPLRDLLDELADLRRANVRMFRGLSDEAWSRIGKANDTPVSVRAIAYILLGHERHHLGVLRERYLA